ncbi:MAG: hypothetical protein WCP69_14905 [Bacteroidota bacterium]
MSLLDNLKKAEAEIVKLRESIHSNESEKGKKKSVLKLNSLEFEQETSIMDYLEQNNKPYQVIVQENFDLLINDKIEFVVMSEQSGFFSSHAVEMKGKVHDNGYFYGNTSQTDATIFRITNNFYPLCYKGVINYLGESELHVVKKKFKLFGSRVPQKYIGSIDYNGNVTMETVESFWEVDGCIYVTSIIADLFSGNLEKRGKFLTNKEQINEMIIDVKQNLIS